jgi:capsular polysaccharide biosynthesis protein
MPAAHHVDAVRRYWYVVAAFVVLGAALGGTLARIEQPTYRAEMRLLVAFRTGAPAGSASGAPLTVTSSSVEAAALIGVDRRLIESRVRAIARSASGARVTDSVVADLRLPYLAQELGGRIRASSPLDTTLIDIDVLDTQQQRAISICEAIAEALDEVVRAEDRSAGIGAASDILVLDRAKVATEFDGVRWEWRLVGGVVGGLAIGVGLALLLKVRRTGSVLQRIDSGE